MMKSRSLSAITLTFLMIISSISVNLLLPKESELLPPEVIFDSGNNSLEVLLMGNSYTQGNNLDSLSESMFQNDVSNANVDQLSGGGLNLDDHANRVQTSGDQWNTTLNSGNWDWVVLQDQSQIPSFPTTEQYWQNSKNGAIILNDVIKDNGGETVFLMTWGRRDGDSQNQLRNPDFLTMQDNLEAGYLMYAENVSTTSRPVWIAPVGLAFKHIYDDVVASGGTPETAGSSFYELYSSDGSHPSLSGSYLAACVIYATITGSNPVGHNGPNGLSASRILELQEAAAATVFNETQNLVYPWMVSPTMSNFADGNSSVILHPSLNESTAISHRPGQSIVDAELNVVAGGHNVWYNNTNLMTTLAPNSTFSNTTVDANGFLRLNGSVLGGSNAGSNSIQITQSVQWQGGNYSYDSFRLACVQGSCGEIHVTGGPLKITANIIIIDAGASIFADELILGYGGAGNSTSRGSNGKSPGAGGAGHGGSGGSGGGTNGGAGGQNYGNGSEPGSSGGNVTFTNANGQTTNDADGGAGGGVIDLAARTIYVNGTLSANGGDGDNGAAPAGGTGPGGSGAGGGSGGSISVIANSVYIGNNALLSANGGDGGAGAPGAQAGIGIGMYDGGNGGGGGSGGMVYVITKPGQITNNGALEANGGNGGARGAPHGTGNYGVAGNNANNGFAFTGTFSGLTGITAYYYDGNYTSPVFGQQGTLNLNSSVVIANNQPLNTSINATYQYSVDGTIWSQWTTFNLTGETLPTFSLIRFNFWLSTTNNSTTPTITSINLNWSNWHSIDNFELGISNNPASNSFWSFPQDLGVVRTGTDFAAIGYTRIDMSLPVNATPIGSGWIHIMPPQFTSDVDITFSLGPKDVLVINSSEIPNTGITVEINRSLLQSSWPSGSSNPSSGIGGVEWGDLGLTCSAPGGYMGYFISGLIVIPYELNQSLGGHNEIVDSLNNYVNQTSGRWALANFPNFPIISSGDTIDSHFVELNNLTVNFTDNILPEVTNISFYINGQEVSEARVGDIVEIRVKVLGNESDSLIDWHLQGLGGITSWPPSSISSMSWDTLHNAYVANYDTSQHSTDYGDSMALWLWLTDAAGNVRSPSGVGAWYTILYLKPIYPQFKTMDVLGCSNVVGNICEAEPGDEINFTASAIGERPDFSTFVYISNPNNATEYFSTQLYWEPASHKYEGSLSLTYAELGWWDIRFKFIDVNRGESVVSIVGVDKLHLIDNTKPIEGILNVNATPDGDTWDISGQWQATVADNSSAVVTISGPNNYESSVILNSNIVSESQNITSYVALGSKETMGVGANGSNYSVTGLIHEQLNQTWPGVTLTNISDSWGTVQHFVTKQDDIIIAKPDIITIIPLQDYYFSSTSVFSTNYPGLLDALYSSTGAEIFIGILNPNPEYVCHIGSGPAGCYNFGEYEMLIEKTELIKDIASSRPWVTLVPLSDQEFEHPEWKHSNGDYTNAGHASLATPFIHQMQRLNMRNVTFEGTYSLNVSAYSFGDYDFEIEISDESNNVALDAVSGVDATITNSPDDDILSLNVLTTAPETLYPGELMIEYNASCSIGCSMIVQISIDGVLVDTLQPTSGQNYVNVTISSLGVQTISLVLSTSEWSVSSVTSNIDVVVTANPSPIWSISCSYSDYETTQFDVAREGSIGNLTISTHTIQCTVANNGNAPGVVQVAPNSILGPFSCTKSTLSIDPNRKQIITCFAEESEDVAGIYNLSIGFEEVTATSNYTIGGWDSNAVLLSPRFSPNQANDNSNDVSDDASESSGKNPATLLLSVIILIVVGFGVIGLIFTMRDKEVSLKSLLEHDSMHSIEEPISLQQDMPALLVTNESRVETSQENNSTEDILRVDSYNQLPPGGEYEQKDGLTFYKQADGIIWQLEDGGSFRRQE